MRKSVGVKVHDEMPIIFDEEYDERVNEELEVYEASRQDIVKQVKRISLSCWRSIHELEATKKQNQEEERISTAVQEGLEQIRREQSKWVDDQKDRMEALVKESRASAPVPVFETCSSLDTSTRTPLKIMNHHSKPPSSFKTGMNLEQILKMNKRRLKVLDEMLS